MKILVSGNIILAAGDEITYGYTDGTEPDVQKWKVYNKAMDSVSFWIDDGFSVVEDVEVPEDYTYGRYFYEGGKFVPNPDWKPYRPTELRIAELEEQVAVHEENDAELLYQICLLQLGITEDDMQ